MGQFVDGMDFGQEMTTKIFLPAGLNQQPWYWPNKLEYFILASEEIKSWYILYLELFSIFLNCFSANDSEVKSHGGSSFDLM